MFPKETPSYEARCHEIKQKAFNIPVAAFARHLTTIFPASMRCVIMDGPTMMTAQTLIVRRIVAANRIACFTNSIIDHEGMLDRDYLRVEKIRMHSSELYTKLQHSCYLIVHDGNQTARTTLPDIKILLQQNIDYIGLVVNISPRDEDMSHLEFRNDIIEFAMGNDYIADGKMFVSYNQGGGTMWAHWFIFVKKRWAVYRPAQFIDLSL